MTESQQDSLKRHRSCLDETENSDEDDLPLTQKHAVKRHRPCTLPLAQSRINGVHPTLDRTKSHSTPHHSDPPTSTAPDDSSRKIASDDDDDLPLVSLTKKEQPGSPTSTTPRIVANAERKKRRIKTKTIDSSRVPNVKSELLESPKRKTSRENSTGLSVRAQKLPKLVAITEDNYEPVNCWWEKKEEEKNNCQWEYLEHHGLLFTPSYEPHHIPVLVREKSVELPPQAEEVANYWCAAMDSDYGKKEKFIHNFWTALLSKLPSTHEIVVSKAQFEDVDFSKIKTYLDDTRDATRAKRKAMTKEERDIEKRRKEQEEGPFMYALFNWLRERVGSYKSEPPSLFRGRGAHPKMGLLKRRIFPEEVTLNCHEDAPVPRLPPDMIGHSWKDIFHDNTVSWLAFYKDTVNGQFKYTFLGAGSGVKGQKDYLKYEKARKLKDHIDKIRKNYYTKMTSEDLVERQLGTATYMLDVLALRVGNEKDSSEEADTVGCCSLRVEHISFDKPNSTITLDFLGKDSIRYLNTVKVDPLVLKNLVSFCKSKKKDEDIFSNISTGQLNKYLRELMPGLSAKVFRTYNASVTLQSELDKLVSGMLDASNPEIVKQFYEAANREVAILCNHQRTVPKQHETSMSKMKSQLQKLEEDLEEFQAYSEYLKKNQNKPFKFTLKTQSKDEDAPVRVSVIKEGMKPEAVERAVAITLKKKVTQELKMKIKDDNKTVSNATSKQHYMDPRITVAFCKKWELPIEKLFNTTLRKKFPWAMYAKSDFQF